MDSSIVRHGRGRWATLHRRLTSWLPLAGVVLAATAAVLGAVLGSTAGAAGASWSTEGVPWTQQGPSTASLDGISCPTAGTCVAVGSWSGASGEQQPLAESLSGGTWTPDGLGVPPGATSAYLSGVSCTSATACVAVGHYSGTTGEEHPLAATLSGATWTFAEIALPGGASSATLSGVSCSGSTTSCHAAGTYTVSTTTSSTTHALIETLSGTTWTATTGISPSGKGNAFLSGISCTSSTACTAIGNWEKTTTGVSEVPLVESLSGTTWSPHVLGGVGFLTFSVR